MTRSYEVHVNGEKRLAFSGDFAQASSPITLEGDSTPFQVADARHRPREAARLLIEWCRSQGGEVVGEDEEYDLIDTDGQ